ncbi:exosortase A [Rheinheimera sp.]|uniref:exosortase A n=1 Tax=Rheinheimera sp. TaxID=1869214 RepID=UPI004047D3C8
MQLPKQATTYWMMVALAVLAYLLLYAGVWLDMERVWRSSATYNHCYLIIPISLWLFFKQKDGVSPPCQDKRSTGLRVPLTLIAMLQLLYLASFASGIALFMHFSAVLSLQLLLWLVLGKQNAKQHWFALAYLIFLLPFGEELSPLLQHITADLTVSLLKLASVPVFREGLYLATPVGLFEVAEACSGLRFLIASMAISVLYAYLTYNRLLKQLLFVLAMLLVSVLANGGRAFMLVYIGEKTNMAYGFGADHYLYGWLFFGAVLLLGFWIGARFADEATELKPARLLTPLHQQSSLFALPVAMAILLLTHIYQRNLPSIDPPLQPDVLSLAIANSSPTHSSDWGINFSDSLQQAHLQDTAGTEYFAAVYANNQLRGKLVGWQNRLFDDNVWFVTDRQATSSYTLLALKNSKQQQRLVLYWYQIGQQQTGNLAKVKLFQAMHLLSGQLGPASIFAVSIPGPLSAEQQQVLLQAAQPLHAAAKSINGASL